MDNETLKKLIDNALAGVRGVGTGATAGLLKYPVAAGMSAYNKTIDKGNMSYNDALNLLNEQEENDTNNHRLASETGNVVGAVGTLGSVLPKIGMKLLRSGAKSSAQMSKEAAEGVPTLLKSAEETVAKRAAMADRQKLDSVFDNAELRKAIQKNDIDTADEILRKFGFKDYNDYIDVIRRDGAAALKDITK